MATYIINRSVCSSWPMSTPEEVRSNKKVDVSNLRIFGSPVMVHIPKEKRKKLHRKSSEMIFIGYEAETKGFRCFNRFTKSITISRDVIFMSRTFQPRLVFLFRRSQLQ